jgi:hypothetical protein
MLGMRRRSIGGQITACRKDIAHLQKDAALLADGIAEMAVTRTSRFTDGAQDAFNRISKHVPRPPRRSQRARGLLGTRLAITALVIGSVAAVSSLLARR